MSETDTPHARAVEAVLGLYPERTGMRQAYRTHAESAVVAIEAAGLHIAPTPPAGTADAPDAGRDRVLSIVEALEDIHANTDDDADAVVILTATAMLRLHARTLPAPDAAPARDEAVDR